MVAENGLSFIETSALDASNVESAFQTILTGARHSGSSNPDSLLNFVIDIYRIVSAKSLESSTSNIEPPKESISVGVSQDNNNQQGNKCC